ncbi:MULTISPECIES: hypothetical protein [unclassified Paenibacillus]|nr:MULTISPECIES: hypothetical protein [unclassified Paenibacillus]
MDNDALIQEINRSYPLEILHIEFHREMIGRVYFLRALHSLPLRVCWII